MIPVNEPLLDGREKEFLLECIDSKWISSEGPFVKKFEDRFSEIVGRRFGIAVSSGTAALDICVAAVGIKAGEEVVMPAFTIISPAAAVIRAGGLPVLVDSDAVTWNMDMSQIERRITEKTRAILVVHIYGLPADMSPLLDLAARNNLKIIEDAAEMHGQTYRGRPCGSFGDISVFSFYPNKLVTTGEGGMIVTDDEVLAEKCRSLRNLCFQSKQRFVHEELGWNFRMCNLQAAVGLAQCERLSDFVQRKRRMGQLYTKLLSDIPGLQLPSARTDYAENIYWVYGVVIDEEMPFDAKDAMRYLARYDIGTRPFFWPMHKQPVFEKLGLFKNESYPVAERLARCGLYLPSGLGLTDGQIETVAGRVKTMITGNYP